ncbi:CopG family transcriptional regulator [Rhodanobacter sp. 7MK24]|uniref:CopG family transcriptional regulator n=1 Tax=Rhodanobacter sp. 7MK24 TaxID=2775922 RepID=UPI0017835A24|nr:CopG family transcriptional regulator [Rhodanobacter sp. 7MK24]MBD8882016.1 CopG family transcriptional regulator [Rhodanobacter sp. 7MK24]
MGATTVRLPDALKTRVAASTKRAGTTVHGFVLDAVAEKAELAERRAEFDTAAKQRYARIVETGETISRDKMRGHLEDRIAGKAARRPAPRTLAKRK